MSKLNELLQNLSTDAVLKQVYLDNPEKVMDEAGLTEQEKAALRSGDEQELIKLTGDTNVMGITVRAPK